MRLTRDEIINSVRAFKARRDDLLHEDTTTFEHHLDRFLEFCANDRLAQSILAPLESKSGCDAAEWWGTAPSYEPKLFFPPDRDEEFALRYKVITYLSTDHDLVARLGIAHRGKDLDAWIELFRTLIIRPFADDLTHRLGAAADFATPEARAVQAVPLNRIPASTESKIFLSHKSIDKPLVYRYYHCLKLLGFDPWLDEPNMAAGANLERELLRGFEHSCAAIFFITESFADEKYLATEIDYAIHQKRDKGAKFAIVTLRYSTTAAVPGLLRPYIYKDIANDLDGFEVVLRALPIELGPARWKAHVV